MSTRKALTFPTVIRSSADADEPEITISTATPDRPDGDIIEPDGAELTDYQQNPVVGFGHFRTEQIPVGATTAITVEPGRGLRARWRWLEGDPFATRVKNAWQQGIVRAASIGFLPLAWEPLKGSNGLRFTRWTLLEWSLVAVPANPEAVRVLKSLGLPVLEYDPDEIVLTFADDPDDEPMTVAPRELTRLIREAVAPLERQLRALQQQRTYDDDDIVVRFHDSPDDVISVDLDELRDVLGSTLGTEIGGLVKTELTAALNYARGRISD